MDQRREFYKCGFNEGLFYDRCRRSELYGGFSDSDNLLVYKADLNVLTCKLVLHFGSSSTPLVNFLMESSFIRRWIYYEDVLFQLIVANFQHWRELQQLLEEDHAIYHESGKCLEFCQFIFNTPDWSRQQTGLFLDELPSEDEPIILAVPWDTVKEVHKDGLKSLLGYK